jgi:multidrug efflux pump subunit AcrA (membrane-fusion protein)
MRPRSLASITVPALRAMAAAMRPAPDTSPPGGPAPLMGELRRSIIAAALVIGLGLGGFGVWAAAAPLAGAAIAPGVISPDGSRRTVQHLEGGIIQQILIEDGSVVRAGDPLVLLEDVQARAGHDVLRARFHTLAAAAARLLAERRAPGSATGSPRPLHSVRTVNSRNRGRLSADAPLPARVQPGDSSQEDS